MTVNSPLRASAALAAATTVLVVAGCGGSSQPTLAKLAANQDAYAGKEVTVSGRVEEQANANGSHYYVLSDPAQDLVELVPAARARPDRGRDVTVSGRFAVDPHVGRLIRITTIKRR